MSAGRFLPHGWLILAPGSTGKSRTGRQGISVFCRPVFVRRLIVHHMYFNPLLTLISKIKTVNESTVNYATLDLTPVNPANSHIPLGGWTNYIAKLVKVQVTGTVLLIFSMLVYFHWFSLLLTLICQIFELWYVGPYWSMITICLVMDGAPLGGGNHFLIYSKAVPTLYKYKCTRSF